MVEGGCWRGQRGARWSASTGSRQPVEGATAGCRQGVLEGPLWGGDRGEGQDTHTCAALGSCLGRPGAGPPGSGSSAHRPAWLIRDAAMATQGRL